jgi:hypothetical protein
MGTHTRERGVVERIQEQRETSGSKKAVNMVSSCKSPGVCELQDVMQSARQYKRDIHFMVPTIQVVNADLPLPSTLSGAGCNRACYRMIDRLRRQGVCWKCACVYHFVFTFYDLKFFSIQSFLPTRAESLPTTPPSCGRVPIGISSVWRGRTALSTQKTTLMGTQPQERDAVEGIPEQRETSGSKKAVNMVSYANLQACVNGRTLCSWRTSTSMRSISRITSRSGSSGSMKCLRIEHSQTKLEQVWLQEQGCLKNIN